jgi:transcriptional regulator with XRE-family HTH domain
MGLALRRLALANQLCKAHDSDVSNASETVAPRRPTLQETVKAARLKRRWSLRQAERETGIHNAHLAQIESGAIAKPDHNVLFALATTYSLDFERLLRLAGHIGRSAAPLRRSPYGAVAWKALTELDQSEQREVVRFIADLQKRRNARVHGR